MTAIIFDELSGHLNKAARSVANNWPGVTTADDIGQDIWIRLLESPEALETVTRMDPGARVSALSAMGQQIASRERIDFDHFSGNFFYSVEDVKDLLDRGVLIEGRERTSTERLDLDEAMQLLHGRNMRYAELIGRRYLEGEPVSGAGAVSTERSALSRAVDALAECMNTVHRNRLRQHTDGPGTRKAMSNADAAVITKNQARHG